MFKVILDFGSEKITAKCKVPSTAVASAFMTLIIKDPVQAQELIYNETVLNKEELEKAFEKYPFAKLSLINQILQRLGLTAEGFIEEIEEQKKP